jgi:hypothetical protein
MGIKFLECETDHTLQFSADVCEMHAALPRYHLCLIAMLLRPRAYFSFTCLDVLSLQELVLPVSSSPLYLLTEM